MSAVTRTSRADVALPRYEDMCRAIAECHRVDEVKDMRDKAEALRAYARQAKNRQAEIECAEIRERAERQAGKLLMEQPKHQGGPVRSKVSTTPPAKLVELGLSKDDSSRFQAKASIPEKQFEAHLAEHRAAGVPVTSNSVMQIAKPARFTPAQRDQHDREFRVITALRAIAEQDCSPEEYVEQLPDYMRPMVEEHFGRAREWLLDFFQLWSKRK